MSVSVLVSRLTLISIALVACAMLLAGTMLLRRERELARGRRVLGRAIAGDLAAAAKDPVRLDEDTPDTLAGQRLPAHWLQTWWGRLLVDAEDRLLVEQCGGSSLRLQLWLLIARLGLALAFPLLALLLLHAGLLPDRPPLVLGFAFAIGFMCPKWLLRRRAAARCARAAHELPLAVDLLRLLQGVGLGLDQSLQVMASDFDEALQVLGPEIAAANRLYSRGRSREHSLQRLATVYGNDDLAALVPLLVQIDRHGGAVQQPLAQLSERLREHRRSEFKARIGKITVKMTGVMVATLLPALIIVTAGPGFIAIIRSLGALSK